MGDVRAIIRLGTVLFCGILCVPLVQTSTPRDLTWGERVEAQVAIERLYYSHQTQTTKSFDEVVPRGVIEDKVREYLRQSLALEKF
ncbi:MAG: hypothetical protein R3344_08015, partial [Acidobacteriota bacterium]|nr:hypothetical protein [Acidobacteriota bacterium]